MRETLIVHAGEFDNLDKTFADAHASKRLAVGRSPASDREPGPTVLLASSADKVGAPSVYMIVGALRNARLVRAESSVEFEALERFPVPVVISNSAGAVRDDLLGVPKFWSPSEFYWAPDGSAERCIEEARGLRDPLAMGSHSRVVHFEIHADEVERAVRFYRDVFSWKIDPWGGEDYRLITTGKAPELGINGGLLKRRGPRPPEGHPVNAYPCTIEVRDVDAFAKKVEEAGGKIVVPKIAVAGVGWLTYANDTEGNMFGMMQPDPGAK